MECFSSEDDEPLLVLNFPGSFGIKASVVQGIGRFGGRATLIGIPVARLATGPRWFGGLAFIGCCLRVEPFAYDFRR